MKLQYTALYLALFGTFGTTAFAADLPVMDEIVISASRVASKLSETPVAIGVVKQDMLKRDKPKTIGEVINRIPGAYVPDTQNLYTPGAPRSVMIGLTNTFGVK